MLFKKPAFLAIIAATLVALVILLFYHSDQPKVFVDDRIGLALILPAAVLGIGTAWLFLSSIRNFKSGLRVPYILLSIGVLLLPMHKLLNVIGAFLIPPGPIYVYIGLLATLCLIVALPVMYFSIRAFAKLISLNSRLGSIPLVLLPSLGAAIVTGLIWLKGAVDDNGGKLTLIASLIGLVMAALVINVLVGLAATILSWRIRGIVGASYTSAINWLTASIAAAAFTLLHAILISFWPNEPSWYAVYDLWPNLLASLLFLRAGHLFWKSGQSPASLATNASYIDAVVSTAQLASDNRDIDKTLDKLRVLTSTMDQQKELSASDKSKLIGVYLEIENYLVTKDPLRNFTKQELRSRLTYDFQQSLKQHNAAA